MVNNRAKSPILHALFLQQSNCSIHVELGLREKDVKIRMLMLMLSLNLVHNFSNSLHHCRDSSNRPCLRITYGTSYIAYGCIKLF
ncbi:hypothetical protein Hanom_Chr15g01377621 [Helianthus anomalus]